MAGITTTRGNVAPSTTTTPTRYEIEYRLLTREVDELIAERDTIDITIKRKMAKIEIMESIMFSDEEAFT